MIDVMKVHLDTGLYDDSTPELQAKSLDRIKKSCKYYCCL